MKDGLKKLFLAITLTLAGALPLAAQTPEDMVRWIYSSLTKQRTRIAAGSGLHVLPRAEKELFHGSHGVIL